MNEIRARSISSFAGSIGGSLGALIGFALINLDLAAWKVVNGWDEPFPWHFDLNPLEEMLFSICCGIFLGGVFGVFQKESPKAAIWIGLVVGVLMSTTCFLPSRRIIK